MAAPARRVEARDILVGYVVLASAIAFVLAMIDKMRARRAGQRIPERVLLGAALLGGSPGLLLAMLVVRHKTRKASFLLRLVLVLALQGAAVWLYMRA